MLLKTCIICVPIYYIMIQSIYFDVQKLIETDWNIMNWFKIINIKSKILFKNIICDVMKRFISVFLNLWVEIQYRITNYPVGSPKNKKIIYIFSLELLI